MGVHAGKGHVHTAFWYTHLVHHLQQAGLVHIVHMCVHVCMRRYVCVVHTHMGDEKVGGERKIN